MQHKKYFLLVVSLLAALSSFTQTAATPTPNKGHKGKFYFFWGYNRGYYTHSDLHLHGDNYDFTLYDVVAKDKQTPFSADVYFDPAKLTIPQCNYGLGYYINDHYSISLSADHMKYVMVQDQTVKISGSIQGSKTSYDGDYNKEDIQVRAELLTFEHTDGLNYIVVELNRSDNLLPLLTAYKGRKIEVNLIEGVGIGALYPRTNAMLLSNPRNDAFHLTGYGASLKVGLNITFFRHFFLAANLKAGFIHMPDIRTTASSRDHGSQKFGFLQDNVLLGWRF
jgi:hypothetical protein